METKKITIAVVAAIALLVVFGFFLMKNQATDFEEDLTNGDELKEDLIPIQEETLNEEQKMALAKISTDCAVQCSYEITYALSFGAKQGVVDGYPRTNSGWCTTKANLRGTLENCYDLGFDCIVTDANKDSCYIGCDGNTAQCI